MTRLFLFFIIYGIGIGIGLVQPNIMKQPGWLLSCFIGMI